MDAQPLYRRLADHYLEAIKAGSMAAGARMPSVRSLMQTHGVSLSTALQACRQLESEGWLEARPRSGYFVCHPTRSGLSPLAEPSIGQAPDPAQYVGIHARVSHFIASGRSQPIRCNLSGARGAPELYPMEELKVISLRVLRQQPELLVSAGPDGGHPALQAALARRVVAKGMALAPDEGW